MTTVDYSFGELGKVDNMFIFLIDTCLNLREFNALKTTLSKVNVS